MTFFHLKYDQNLRGFHLYQIILFLDNPQCTHISVLLKYSIQHLST